MPKLAATLGTLAGPVIPNTLTLLNEAVSTLVSDDIMGLLIVAVVEDSACALFRLENGTLTVISADNRFTTHPDPPGKYYCHFDEGFFKVTNKVDNGKTIKISLYGLEQRTT